MSEKTFYSPKIRMPGHPEMQSGYMKMPQPTVPYAYMPPTIVSQTPRQPTPVQQPRIPGREATEKLLAFCKGKRVLFSLDGENITISAKERGYSVDHKTLTQKLREVCQSVDFHVTANNGGKDGILGGPYPKDWKTYVFQIERLRHSDGESETRANSDNKFLCATTDAIVRSRKKYDILIIGTGDGNLGRDMANFAKEKKPKMEVATLSFAGTMAGHLKPQVTPAITRNFQIGSDLLISLNAKMEQIETTRPRTMIQIVGTFIWETFFSW
ncbi:MAG: hypothetical protein FWD31_09915 [Planctomycetaceae bacterium]|nr:hypothetical protein [Planctomycetaceae bacterium]